MADFLKNFLSLIVFISLWQDQKKDKSFNVCLKSLFRQIFCLRFYKYNLNLKLFIIFKKQKALIKNFWLSGKIFYFWKFFLTFFFQKTRVQRKLHIASCFTFLKTVLWGIFRFFYYQEKHNLAKKFIFFCSPILQMP